MTKVVSLACLFIALLITFVVVPALIEWRKRIKWKKLYDSVQIGDKYIQNRSNSNPFERQWGEVITITDKKMNADGIPYVKYLGDMGFECSKSLISLIEYWDYEPYNNQDKQQ